MAYGRYRRTTRRSSYSSRGRMQRRPARRTRRTRTRRSSAQRIIIQVVGGPGGAVPVAVTAGKKGARQVRARF